MPPEDRDPAHVLDMLAHAREAQSFAADKTQAEYLADRQLQLAVERAVEIVGEAARRVSPAFRAAHPEIPWLKIIGQRNVLVHEYGDVDPVLIWGLIRKELPGLIRHLEELLAEGSWEVRPSP